MNRRLILIGAAVTGILIIGVFLLLRTDKPPTDTTTLAIQEYMKQAEKTLAAGDLLRAKNIYTKLVEQYPNTPFIKTAQEKLEELNMKILFSSSKDEASTIYVVKEGDTLGKIAKAHNTTAELLMRSNDLASDLIHPGKRLKITTAQFSIIVDKSQNVLTLKGNDEVYKMYTVSTGLNDTTPTGKFKVVNKLVNPVWYKAGAVVPSGSPENILGTRWLGISEDGYGIHGTTEPDTIGRSITAGCVRMRNADVEELYAIIPVGTEVTIVD